MTLLLNGMQPIAEMAEEIFWIHRFIFNDQVVHLKPYHLDGADAGRRRSFS